MHGDSLARVVLVDSSFAVLFDSYIKPSAEILDYRTNITNIKAETLKNAPSLERVVSQV